MKVVLAAVNAKYIHSNLAVYSLKAYADQGLNGQADIVIREYTINQDREKVLADLYMQKPELLAFSCYIWNISYVRELAVQIKTLLPKTDLWLGGPEVSYEPEKLFEELPIKGIMLGEGEAVFENLVSVYLRYEEQQREDALRRMKGIACRDFSTAPDTKLLQMDELPFVYESFPEECFENRIVYYETSRGCPFCCAYCLSSIDKQVRFRSFSLVKRELRFFLDRNVSQVKFVDRTFNCNPAHALEIWNYIKEHDNRITNFHFEIAADIMTDEELALIRTMRPGLIQLEIGVQTTNRETIRAVNRRMDFDKVISVVRRIQEGKNVHLHLDLIAGLPKENFQSFRNSFNEVYALHPNQLQLGFLKVLKGTPIAENAAHDGIRYWTIPPYEVLFTKELTFREVLQLKAVEEMVDLYYNSGQFCHTLRFLETYFGEAFAMYAALAGFYRERGYGTQLPSRVRKYEILLEFAKDIPGVSSEKCGELLTLDLYLRENLKTRPFFSESQQPYKERIRAFYKREEMNRQYLPEYAEFDFKQLMKLTHVEIFDLLADSRQVLLFNYKEKDALTNNAKLITITHEL
ncbi:MAG TPA: B12-binding domain-containing radical SAM protein, partial [Lachnospiraceae bacterium]|nr:B12-binding domain-containing radical SAM protein [Lachnospiraceae bacterium]